MPGVAITTDIIVGFPGEREADHRETLRLMKRLRFDSAFMFRYSVRIGTAAAELEDDVPEPEKISRLEEVIGLQKQTTEEINNGLVGSTTEVLVEGPSHGDRERLYGRNRQARAVVFDGPVELAGKLARVRIDSASAWTLHGTVDESDAED
jgi:tRNA-2-methylthio-N6-dimethylallyladenosine synthase